MTRLEPGTAAEVAGELGAAAALATGLPRRVVAEQALSQLDREPE